MKTQLKVLSILAAALAVVFSTAGVSMAFSAPSEMANCREIDSGLSFECDPVSNLAVVNTSVIPVTGLGLTSFTTSLRSVNDLVSVSPATSLRAINEVALEVSDLSLSDFDVSAFGLGDISLSDFAITLKDSLIQEDDLFLMGDYYSGGQYGSGY